MTTRRSWTGSGWRTLASALVLLGSGPVWSQVDDDLTRLSLEELMTMEVNSAARKPQALADTATALHVITREDIRRSGATSLPEVLRLAPGLQVSRIDGSRYAVTIRGFASRYAGKLLVLLDGRTLFSPLFNGTFWESQDPMLEDIERIEVIRGPGGTMWGANAFNGVINIITRPARDTQGTLVGVQAGPDESGLSVRHGGRLEGGGHFRVYGKTARQDALTTDGGQAAHDGLRRERAGFRVDLQPQAGDRLTLQGDVQSARADVTELDTQWTIPGVNFAPDTHVEQGANLLLHWTREVNPDHELHLLAFVDHNEGRSKALTLSVDTLSLEFQQRLRLNTLHELTWGGGWRYVRDNTRGGFTLSMEPPTVSSHVYSAFVQDEIRLSPDWRLIAGSKFEHNDATGLEVQPSVRLHWQASPSDSFWAAVSRAVETPSRATLNSRIHYLVLPPAPPFVPVTTVVGLQGNPHMVSQELVAREAGYRGMFGPHLSLDLTVFHHRYDHLASVGSPVLVMGFPYSTAMAPFTNDLRGQAYGVELAAKWQVSPTWRLSGSVSSLRMKLSPYAGGSGDSVFGSEGSSPAYMGQLHSQWDLSHNLELDAHLYRQGRLKDLDIPAHTRLDLRLGWRVRSGVELSLTGRNLLQGHHREFRAEDVQSSDIPRSWLLQGHWKF